MKEWHKAITRSLEAQGWTPADLGDALQAAGYDRPTANTLSNWTSGKHEPTRPSMWALGDVLGWDDDQTVRLIAAVADFRGE